VLVGGPGFETPGPHGPESDAIPSNQADFCGFQFETSDLAASRVQNWVNFPANYYMNYYRPIPANRWPH
jgi:hypothetical protein